MNQMTGSQMSVQWDGTKLIQVGVQIQRCYDSQNGFTPVLVKNIENPSFMDCQCLDTNTVPAERRFDGPIQDTIFPQTIDYTWDTPVEFQPKAEEFPWGMQVRTKSGSMRGNLEIEYEALQTLYISQSHNFREGTIIRQGTVIGRVYTNTTTYLYGLECPGADQYGNGGHCFTYTQYSKDFSTCGHSTVQSVTTGQYLPKGVQLVQKDTNDHVVATGTTADTAFISRGQGVPVIITSGVFNTHDTIFASLAYDETVNPYGGMSITGNISWAAVNSLQTWPPVEITNKGSCTAGTAFHIHIAGVVNATVYAGSNQPGASSTSLDWVFVDSQQPGVECDSDNLELHVHPEDGTCSILPTLKAKCTKRVEEEGDRVTVLLDSPDRKFLPWKSVTIGSSGSLTTYVNWINNDKGKILPPTSATKYVYQIEEIVQADASNIHTLYCYDNCPNANSPDFNNCDSSTQPSMGSSQPTDPCYKPFPTKLSKFVNSGQAGSCSKKPVWTINATYIDGNPSINITWIVSKSNSGPGDLYSIKSIEVVDPGKNCDPSNPPTLTFTESAADTCTSLPTGWTLECRQGNDVNDFRQARIYSFDASTGVLTDVENDQPILISGPLANSKQYGPFFEPPSAANLDELLCDYDASEVCSWTIYQSQTLTFFNYETGPSSTRVSLLYGTTRVVTISKPLNLLYTHQGHTSNSNADYDGSKFLFSYAGPDQLSGFPNLCLDANTYERASYCIDAPASDATISIPDITINSNIPLTDLSGTTFYYALPSILSEYYPIAANASICDNLDLANLPVPPTFSEFFQHPSNLNQGIPSPSDLQGYLNNGFPVVVRGQTLVELAVAGNF